MIMDVRCSEKPLSDICIKTEPTTMTHCYNLVSNKVVYYDELYYQN